MDKIPNIVFIALDEGTIYISAYHVCCLLAYPTSKFTANLKITMYYRIYVFMSTDDFEIKCIYADAVLAGLKIIIRGMLQNAI